MSIVRNELGKIRILVCDHRGEGALQLARALRSSDRQLEFSQTLRQSLDRLRRTRADLIVLDPITDAGLHELEALDRARQKPTLVPLLLVRDTGLDPNWRRATLAVRAPAWDMVGRDATPEEVRRRAERLIAETQLHREVSDLRHRASHDDRTDLLRPRSFQSRLAEHFSAAQRHGLPLTLALVDLDNFGMVNKQFDHTVGDELIARVGGAIRRLLRAEDVAGRLGGDEFAVLLPFTAPSDAAAVVERLRAEIADLSTKSLGNGNAPVRVSGSIGYAHYDGTNLTTEEQLRKRSEEALRRAKTSGGDQAICFDDETLAPAGESVG
ncbi:MAG: GGDEF domain-containing protein [Planctomycetota bacterium]|jgi:diguanylate cyclase (GGDEF)-like protein